MAGLNKLVYNNLVILKNASIYRKISIDLVFNKQMVIILNVLYRKGYILGYIYILKYKVRVFLKYYCEIGVLNGIKLFNKKYVFSYKSMKYLYINMYKLQHVYFFSTSKGIYSLDEILLKKLNVGGILYFCIVL